MIIRIAMGMGEIVDIVAEGMEMIQKKRMKRKKRMNMMKTMIARTKRVMMYLILNLWKSPKRIKLIRDTPKSKPCLINQSIKLIATVSIVKRCANFIKSRV